MRVRAVARAAAMLLLFSAPAADAAPPDPIRTDLFSFPGAVAHPASAASAGTALADRWLGDEPFWNPAIANGRAAVVSGLLLRVNRQDLRADNRHYDEQPAFFDAAGAWVAFPLRPVTLGVYVFQPVLRLEDNAFERGILASPTPPAIVHSNTSMREVRGGVVTALGLGRARAGVAVEWTYRSDRYQTTEQSGAPDEGTRSAEFSGQAPSGQAGARVDFGDLEKPAFSVGAGLRYLPELTVDGEQRWDLLSGAGSATLSARREAGIEGGFSLRWAATPALELLAGGGGRTAQEWQGFDVTSGASSSWSAALRYHDPLEAWTVRFGLGREQQGDAPESNAGVIGLGIGWNLDQTLIEVGVVRRSLERSDQPTSFDDRVVVSVGFEL